MVDDYRKFVEGKPTCPNCKSIQYILDNSYAFWCMKCKWVEYKPKDEDEPDGGVPSTL